MVFAFYSLTTQQRIVGTRKAHLFANKVGWFTSTALTRLRAYRVCDRVPHAMARRRFDRPLLGGQKELFDATDGVDGENWHHINLQAVNEATGLALWPEQWPLSALRADERRSANTTGRAYIRVTHDRAALECLRTAATYVRNPNTDGARIIIGVDVAGTAKTSANFTVAAVFAFSRLWRVHDGRHHRR